MFKGKKRNSARPGDLSEHDDGRGTAITLTLAVILLYIILAVILQFFGTSKKYIEAEKLDDLLTVDIIHEDQTTTSYSGNIFRLRLKQIMSMCMYLCLRAAGFLLPCSVLAITMPISRFLHRTISSYTVVILQSGWRQILQDT